MSYAEIQSILGSDAEKLLKHVCKTVAKERLHLPGPDWVDRIFGVSDRSPRVLRSLQTLFSHGRLGGTGYLSILPIDQGIEHSAGASLLVVKVSGEFHGVTAPTTPNGSRIV